MEAHERILGKRLVERPEASLRLPGAPGEQLERARVAIDVDPSARAEALTPPQFVRLAELLGAAGEGAA